jgi:HEAT repeat protein
MKHTAFAVMSIALAALCGSAIARPAAADDEVGVLLAQLDERRAVDGGDDALIMTAIEGLMAAPAEQALRKVLQGDHSDAIKRRALFVLAQTDAAEAQDLLLRMAGNDADPLRHDAIRALGIGGTPASLSALVAVYRDGDAATRESVLAAMLIADASDSVLELARTADSDDDFAAAVRTLGAMGATDALRTLLDDGVKTAGLVQAYAIAGDLDGLRRIAAQTDDREQRLRAISSMGMVSDSAAGEALLQAYRQAPDDETRNAALQGLLIRDDDDGILTLFRASEDGEEKRRLLRTLVHMNSDLVLDVIDATLDGEAR